MCFYLRSVAKAILSRGEWLILTEWSTVCNTHNICGCSGSYGNFWIYMNIIGGNEEKRSCVSQIPIGMLVFTDQTGRDIWK